MKKLIILSLGALLSFSLNAQYSDANQDTEQNSKEYNAQEDRYINSPHDEVFEQGIEAEEADDLTTPPDQDPNLAPIDSVEENEFEDAQEFW